MTRSVAVLTYGWEWEIYDLSVRARNIEHKRVDRLVLDPLEDESAEVFARDLWW